MALARPTIQEAKGWLSLGSTPSVCHHHRLHRTLCGPCLVSAPPSDFPTSTLGIPTDIFSPLLAHNIARARLSVASSLTNHHCASLIHTLSIMSQRPSTPVKVPSSAANYTPATLDPDLRSQINTILLKDGHITKLVLLTTIPKPVPLTQFLPVSRIQEALLHALNSNSSNWPTTIQNHALTLLRSGEVTTYPALLRRVLEDVREGQPSSTSSTNGKSSSAAAATNGNGDTKKTNGTPASDKLPLAIPTSVIEEALRITRECLDSVCEIEEKGSG